MKEFARALIAFGCQLGAEGKSQEWVNSIPMYSAVTIGKAILEQGEKERIQKVGILRDVRFANLAVDSGTVLSFHCVHVLATNPHDERFPIAFDLEENLNFGKEEYENLFHKEIEKALENGVEVCAVIIDNLPSQVMGLRNCLESEDVRMRAVMHIPCFAHMANLVFKHSVKQLPVMKDAFNGVDAMISFLRRPEISEEIQGRCPKTVRTRWLYVYDSLSFICDNSDTIDRLLQTTNGPVSSVPVLWKEIRIVLIPLKLFVLHVERRDSCLSDIIDVVCEVLREWTVALTLVTQEVTMKFLETISAMFVAYAVNNAWDEACAAYAFSMSGRFCIRKRESGFVALEQANDPEYVAPSIALLSQQFEAWMGKAVYSLRREEWMKEICRWLEEEDFDDDPEYHIESLSGYVSEEDCDWATDDEGETSDAQELSAADEMIQSNDPNLSQFEEEEDKREPEQRDETALSWVTLRRLRISEEFEMLMNESLPDRLERDMVGSAFARGEKKVCEMASLLGMNVIHVKKMFNSWLFSRPEELQFADLLMTNENNLWRSAHKYEEWSELATIALRFVTVGTSEADVERILSVQKNIMGDHMVNAGTKMMFARLQACINQRPH